MATTYTDCITFTGESSDFTLKATYKEWDGTVEYSTDHNTWTVWNGTAVSSVNKKLYLRGSGNTTFYTKNGAEFVLSARAACSGNIQTLLEYSNPPATTLADSCYNSMFSGCKSLTAAPALPATTLTEFCYSNMFIGCTNLITAPELPATTLASYCYSGMFNGCTNLITAPELPATTLAWYCYYYMFDGCKSLTATPALPATTLINGCYYGMFINCTKLTTAPALPATTLANDCYNNMFRECTSLKISTTQSSEYPTAWRIPSSGTLSSTATRRNSNMLANTGGTFTSNPSINTTYYGAWSLVETYNITYNLTNCTGASTNPTTINEGTTATLSFTSNDGYSFPDEITVSGVESYTWDKSTGTLTLTNATSDVSITINCIVAYPKINSFTYFGKQINNINGKPIKYVHHSGNTYEMVYLDANGNYLRDANGYVLQDSNGNYLEFTEALETPQNVTANGTTVSWDEVENATSYDILADGVSIGTVEGAVMEDELAGTWIFNDDKPYMGERGVAVSFTFNFVSNNDSFSTLRIDDSGAATPSGQIYLYYNDVTAAYSNGVSAGIPTWNELAYRTITITSKLSEVTNGDTLLTWLQANATKQ